MFYYVYILNCKNGFYTGCTNNLKDRFNRHNKGEVVATKEQKPLTLINYFAFRDKYKAYNFEKYLKSGSGRVFIKKHFTN